MRELPQQDHADLGIVDDEHTPDMRMASGATEAIQENYPPTYELEFRS
jgi:hypothetical protein